MSGDRGDGNGSEGPPVVPAGGAGAPVISNRGAPPPFGTDLAVGLLTADRHTYTAKTVRSFWDQHNEGEDWRRFKPIWYDDGSSDWAQQRIYASGFVPIDSPRTRQGQLAGLKALTLAALDLGCEWFLYLENDWQWVRPIPFAALDKTYVQCLRLYGRLKAQSGPRAKTGARRMGTHELISWRQSMVPGCEIGMAHWAGPPSIIRTKLLANAVVGAKNVSAVSRTLNNIVTMRTVENCVWHIGDELTPDAKP